MNEMLAQSTFFGAVITLLTYELGVWIKKKTNLSIMNPLLLSVIFVVIFLRVFHVDYEVYEQGAKYVGYFLTPVTVALAIPLYRRMVLLKKYPKAIFGAITVGVFTALIGVWLMSLAFGLNHEQYVTLLPKSITTAIGMGLSDKLGGIVSITVLSISITGIFGHVAAPFLLKLFKIDEPIAKGLAIGTSCHALGTAKAMELGEIEGAMSSLSIVVAGIMTVIAAQMFAMFI